MDNQEEKCKYYSTSPRQSTASSVSNTDSTSSGSDVFSTFTATKDKAERRQSGPKVNSTQYLSQRIVFLGPPKCGKTSLIRRLVNGSFQKRYVPTICDMFMKTYKHNGMRIEVNFLDTDGYEQFPNELKLAVQTADAFVLVFSTDPSDQVTGRLPILEQIKSQWRYIKEIRHDMKSSSIPAITVHNKIENVSPNFELPLQFQLFLSSEDLSVVETSAKENIGLNDILVSLLNLSKNPYLINIRSELQINNNDFSRLRLASQASDKVEEAINQRKDSLVDIFSNARRNTVAWMTGSFKKKDDCPIQ